MGHLPVRIGLVAIAPRCVCVSERKGTATWSSRSACRLTAWRTADAAHRCDHLDSSAAAPPPRGSLEPVAAFSCCLGGVIAHKVSRRFAGWPPRRAANRLLRAQRILILQCAAPDVARQKGKSALCSKRFRVLMR
eukprot:scaffold43570_cov80-Phaeocystis_antarctica.AAC.4